MRWNSHKKPVRTRSRQADFAVNHRDNPFKADEPTSYRGLIFSVLGSGSVLGVAGLMMFHPAFQIDVISIAGTARTDYAEVQKTARQVMDTKIWWVIPGQNYFFLNKNSLEEVIQNRFRLQSVKTTTEFPHTLKIELTERAPQLTVVQNNALIALDADGNEVSRLGRVQVDAPEAAKIMSEARLVQKSSGEAFKGLPVLILPGAVASSTASSTSQASEGLISGVIAWNSFLSDNKKPADYFTVTTQSGKVTEGEAVLASGVKLLVNYTDNRDSQFLAVRTFWEQKKTTSSIQYLDLRYPGKVFWK